MDMLFRMVALPSKYVFISRPTAAPRSGSLPVRISLRISARARAPTQAIHPACSTTTLVMMNRVNFAEPLMKSISLSFFFLVFIIVVIIILTIIIGIRIDLRPSNKCQLRLLDVIFFSCMFICCWFIQDTLPFLRLCVIIVFV